MKIIRVAMPDGSKWDVPAEIVAKDRALYYEKREPGCYKKEFDLAMSDRSELLDWACNNMDWYQVGEHAVKAKDPPGLTPADFQEGWCNGQKDVLDI